VERTPAVDAMSGKYVMGDPLSQVQTMEPAMRGV
jgi:hypothetical protein